MSCDHPSTIGMFLQYCLLPRCLSTAVDALYCAHFVSTIIKIGTPFFLWAHFYDQVLDSGRKSERPQVPKSLKISSPSSLLSSRFFSRFFSCFSFSTHFLPASCTQNEAHNSLLLSILFYCCLSADSHYSLPSGELHPE